MNLIITIDIKISDQQLFAELSEMKKESPEWTAYKKKRQEERERFIRSIDDAAKSRIVQQWVKNSSIEEFSFESESDKALRKCFFDADLGWELILRITHASSDDRCLSRLGAWHLEDWLAMHGYAVIHRVEKEAIRSKAFAKALAVVYQNSMPPEVYQRVSLQ